MFDYVVVDWDSINWDDRLVDILFSSKSFDLCLNYVDSHSGDLVILFGIEDLFS